MENYYVIGAKQKKGVFQDWEQYERGMVLNVLPQQNQAHKCVDYVSPLNVISDEKSSVSFTAGTIEKNHLYVGTTTEVMVYQLPDFKRVGYLTLPPFNDIHHVRPTSKGNLLVVNTGLDCVFEISPHGQFVNEWSVTGEDVWSRFSRTIDYRKVPTTKPHKSHPNFVFQIRDEIWATRCLQKDAICLNKPGKQIVIGGDLIHDGVVAGNMIYFTQVTGKVVAVNLHTLEINKVYDLKPFTPSNQPLGWCRGILPLDKQTVIVGFTRIRPSKKRQVDGTTNWEGEYGVMPTRIACYHLQKGKLLWEVDLEKFGMNAIYSIHSV